MSSSSSAAVRVAVRVRPFNEREVHRQSKCVIRMKGRQTELSKPNEAESTKKFTFDYSYWSFEKRDRHYASQEKVFGDLGKIVLECALSGYNTCVFAYGQTGSGKTYSMMGWEDGNPGLIPRISEGLFGNEKSASAHAQETFKAEVSYLEIYNEKVRDLMELKSQKDKHNLRVREHPETGPYVENLSKHTVSELDDIMHLIKIGNKQRTTAATLMNDVSSRSHAIFTINFVYAKVENDIPCETTSKINLVDLAGSERVETSGASGDRLKEGSNINKSLTTLGLVISALAQQSLSSSSSTSSFVPYRDSVLTWLLKDSLGGNSKTIMLATISPADVNYGETLSTLRYANRAKNILNKPTVNEDSNVKLIRQLRAEIAQLKALIGKMDPTQLNSLQVKLDHSEALMANLTSQWEDKWERAHEILREKSLAVTDSGATLKLESEQPHLVEISSARFCTSITICNLKEGRTTFGLIDEKPDVILTGADIKNLHCSVSYQGDRVTLLPEEESLCYVDGEQILSPTELTQGNIITFGASSSFRFNFPAQAERLRQSAIDKEEEERPLSWARPFPLGRNKGGESSLPVGENDVDSSSSSREIEKEKAALEEEKLKHSRMVEEERQRLSALRREIDNQKERVRRDEEERKREGLEKEEEVRKLQTKLKELEIESERSLLRELELMKEEERRKLEALQKEIAVKDELHQAVQEEKVKEQQEKEEKEQQLVALQEEIKRIRYSSSPPLSLRSQTLKTTPIGSEASSLVVASSSSLTLQPDRENRVSGSPSPLALNLKKYLEANHNLEACPQVQVDVEGVFSGFLIKQGEVVKNWKKRFFVFNPHKRTLTYFTDHTRKNVKGIIYFDGIRLVYEDKATGEGVKEWNHTFHICTDMRNYHIRAQTKAVMRIWMDLLLSTKI